MDSLFFFVAMECGYMAASEKFNAYAERLLHLERAVEFLHPARPPTPSHGHFSILPVMSLRYGRIF